MVEGESSDRFPDFVMVDHKDVQDPDMKTIKNWLKPNDSDSPASEYRKHLRSHAAGTGEWIFETEQYHEWSQSDTIGNLWIRGIPGCGKSVVAANLTSRLQRLDDPPVPVLFFFFREIIQTNRTPQSLVQDFCRELIDHSRLLQSNLKKLREDFPDEVPFDKLWEALSSALKTMEKVYCVVDALDEMERGHDQWLENFLDLGRQFPKSIKIIVTSRQVPHVEKHMFKSHLVDLRLDRRRVDRDISTYVSKRLEDSHLGIPQNDIETIREAICERGNGLFLYARLMLDELLRCPDDLKSRVHNLPHGLGDMYSDILREHAARSGISSDLQRLILEWITHSARPLRLLELTAMIEASPECKYFGPDIKLTIQASCGPLLEICEDGVIQIIHHSLTEFILNRDVAHIEINQKSRDSAILDSKAVHRKIARTCINYLASGCFREWQFTEFRDHEPEERQSLFLQFYFLRYATLEWPFHVAKAGDDIELLDKLGEFCRDGNHDYEAWNDIWRACQGEDVPRRCSALHVSAYTGLFTLAQYLLSQGADPDSKDEDGRTPIVYAVMKGHHEIVSLLLRNNASHDVKVDTYLHPTKIKSLIHYACKLNHVQALCALLDGGMSPVAKDDGLSTSGQYYCEILGKEVWYGGSPQVSVLGLACQHGHVEVVRELMKRMNPVDLCAGNLHLAARKGKAETLAALLENEHVRLSINDRDSDGNTPLYLAARKGSAPAIRVLLDHGADITVRSLNSNSPPEPPRGKDPRINLHISPSYTPLHGWCIGFARETDDFLFIEQEDIIPALELLLQAGCDINARDYRGRTPLFAWPELPWGDMRPHEYIGILLDRGADPTMVDDEGQTPLYSAKSREDIVRVLVNAGADINVQRKKDGLTALMCIALAQNHADPAVFHELDADFDRQDWNGNTALHHYFRRKPAGTDCHLETWLSLSNLQIQNNLGRTPFHEFMYRQGRYMDTKKNGLQPLLEMVKRGTSLESKDGLGRTALLIALVNTTSCSLEQVEELLKLGANAQAIDYRGKSALHYAFKSFHKHGYQSEDCTIDVPRCLIKAGANVQAVDHEGNTLVHDLIGQALSKEDRWSCIEKRVREAIELGVPYQQANYKGRTALHVAAAIENDPGYDGSGMAMARLEFLLQPTMPFDVNDRDNDGVSPLHVAAASSDTNTLILIEHGADIQAKDRDGRSPLHFAATAGQSNVVGLLTEIYSERSINIDQQCAERRSALHQAAQSGSSEAVRLLLKAGASPALADERGRTPLHAAAEFELKTHAQRMRTVTENAIDLPAISQHSRDRPKDAFSRMDLIVSDEDDARCIQEVIQLLLSAGADPDQKDMNGHRPLDVAVMLGCSPAVDELKHSMNDSGSQPLDPVGESMLAVSESKVRELVESIQVPENSIQFFERVFSTGNERLAEAFVRNHPLKSVDGDKSPLCLLARWGFTSMMKRLLSYVEYPETLIPFLLEHAGKRTLSNLGMIEFLIKSLSKDNKEALSTLLYKFSSGRVWWYSHALSLLLDAGADPNVNPQYQLTPLIISLSPDHGTGQGNYRYNWRNEILRLLLKNGADPNGAPKGGWWTPLASAIRGGCSVETIQLLLSHGAEVNPKGESLIIVAIDSRNYRAIEILLKAGANPNGDEDQIPLMNAAKDSRHSRLPSRDNPDDTAMCLLLQYGADPLSLTKEGSSTVFHDLCREECFIRPILEMGIDLNIVDGEGCTPLIKACQVYGPAKIYPHDIRPGALELIEAGADVHAVDHTGSSAFHYAASWGKLSVIQELLNKSAALSVRNNQGYTPLTSALKSYSTAGWQWKGEVCTTINFLLDVGADPLSTLPDGRTALHCVAWMLMNSSNVDREEQIEGDRGEDHFTTATQLYQRFIDAGCDREARDNDGNTPIFYYVSAPKPSILRDNWDPPRPSNPEDYKKMFSEHDVHKTNYKGDSLLHAIARRQKWPCDADEGEKVFSTLVDLGLNPFKENSSGQTALDIAAAHEKPKILALFARDD